MRSASHLLLGSVTVAGAAVAVLCVLGSGPARADSARPTGWSPGPSMPAKFDGRWDASVASFDPTGSVVVFGGSPKDAKHPFYRDTWLYRNVAWQKGLAAPSGLSARGGAAMAYDPDIGKIVLFGGQGATWPPKADTWLFDGTTWTRGPRSPATMAGRTGAEMAYDPLLHALVLFGGSGVVPYTDTWLFDGTSWAAGPAAPPAMEPRVFFGMTYDAVLGEIVVAGGDGGRDVWCIGGTGWAQGPSLPPGQPKERFRLAFDPQLGGDVFVSGLGPGQASAGEWILRGGAWTQLQNYNASPWPSDRIDGALVWNGAEGALMLVGGVADDFNGGETALTDAWFLREVPPSVASVAVSPTAPSSADRIVATAGAVNGGWGGITYQWAWLRNGQVIPGQTGPTLPVGIYVHGDVIQAEVHLTDAAGYAGPWTASDPVTVVDRPPSIGSVSLSPANPYVTSTISAVAYRVSDPDGDAVTLRYTWSVNGTPVAGHSTPSLPGPFAAGDTIAVKVKPVDSVGMSGDAASSAPVTPRWNISAGPGVPGGTIYQVSGGGYAPAETVTVTVDAPSAPVLATATTDSGGSFQTSLTLPTPLTGGTHLLYGSGGSSGVLGPGPVTVIPTGSLSPRAVGAADTTVFSGAGYLPAETVSVSFPGGPALSVPTDATGSVSVSLVSPPEPAGGGVVTATAPSGSATPAFQVLPRVSLPSTGTPGTAVAFRATGFGAGETVRAAFDGSSAVQGFAADAWGTASGNLSLAVTWGRHTVTFSGSGSGAAASASITASPWLALSPPSGPAGQVVQATSGPGWVPGSGVTLTFGSTTIGTFTADQDGVVSATFTVPSRAPGTVGVKLADSVLSAKASATFTVTT